MAVGSDNKTKLVPDVTVEVGDALEATTNVPTNNVRIVPVSICSTGWLENGDTSLILAAWKGHLEVATMLAELDMDSASIMTGLLHDTVEDTGATLDDLRELFGDEVALLVDGVTKLDKLELHIQPGLVADAGRRRAGFQPAELRAARTGGHRAACRCARFQLRAA